MSESIGTGTWWEQGIVILQLAVHAGLLVWALAGWFELTSAGVPLPAVNNPLFSTGVLVTQWGLVTLAATTFLAGYLTRWPHLPAAMAVLYAAMAALCAYQSFFILTHPGRFRSMAIEYIEYALILAFLFFSPAMRTRFS